MNLSQHFTDLKLLVFDIDGVLSTPDVIYDHQGQQAKSFNIRDGLGIVMARKAGLKTAVLTGRSIPAVEHRIKDLKIDFYEHGQFYKEAGLRRIIEAAGVQDDEVLYMGDDLLDLVCQPIVGVFAAPADAVPAVLAKADWVASKPGGQGAVRELIEQILHAKGVMQDIYDDYVKGEK